MAYANTACSIVCMQGYRLDTENLEGHREHMGRLIERELREAVNDGLIEFRVGMCMGADIWAAERAIKLRNRVFPRIRLHCHLPCETRARNWPVHWRERYFACLNQADQVQVLQRRYSEGCTIRRTREMIDGSRRLIALYDNVAEGFIERAVSYAELLGIESHIIQPLEGPPVQAGILGGYHALRSDQMESTYSDRFGTGKSAIKRA